MRDYDTVTLTSMSLVTIWPRLLLGLFFLSGISGLLYEVPCARMLHLLFSDTVLAVSTVLASFMAGLALGSFWIGRYVDRQPIDLCRGPRPGLPARHDRPDTRAGQRSATHPPVRGHRRPHGVHSTAAAPSTTPPPAPITAGEGNSVLSG
jgi:hypothetical protein